MQIARTIHKQKEVLPYKNNRQHIGRFVRYSNMAYFSEDKIRKKLAADGALKIFIYSYEGMLAFMAEFPEDIVVSFRGVGTSDEFRTIMRFWKKVYRGVKVHAGFSDSVEKFSTYIAHDLKTLPDNKRTIYTGHSFGGSMAMLLTLSHKPDMIYTFGSPKSGGGTGYTDLFRDVEVIRVQIKADFVTMLPTSLPVLLDYVHIGDPIYIDGIPCPYESHRMIEYTTSIMRMERRLQEQNTKMTGIT